MSVRLTPQTAVSDVPLAWNPIRSPRDALQSRFVARPQGDAGYCPRPVSRRRDLREAADLDPTGDAVAGDRIDEAAGPGDGAGLLQTEDHTHLRRRSALNDAAAGEGAGAGHGDRHRGRRGRDGAVDDDLEVGGEAGIDHRRRQCGGHAGRERTDAQVDRTAEAATGHDVDTQVGPAAGRQRELLRRDGDAEVADCRHRGLGVGGRAAARW